MLKQYSNITKLYLSFLFFGVAAYFSNVFIYKGISPDNRSPMFFMPIVIYWATVLFLVPAGILADKFGRKWLLLLAILIQAFALIVHSFMSRDFIGISVSYGLFAAVQLSVLDAFLYDDLKQKNRENLMIIVYGVLLLFFYLGQSISLLPSIRFYSMNYPLIFAVIFYVLAMIPTLLLKEEKNEVETDQTNNTSGSIKQSFTTLFRSKMILKLFMLSFFAEFFIRLLQNNQFNNYIVNYLNLSILQYGYISYFMLISSLILVVLTFIIEKKLKEKALRYTVLAAYSMLVFSLIKFYDSFETPIIKMVLLMSLAVALRPVLSKYLNANFGSKNRATTLSIIYGLNMLISGLLFFLLYILIILLLFPRFSEIHF